MKRPFRAVCFFGALVFVAALGAALFPGRLLADEIKLPYPEPRSPNELPDTALVQTTKGDFEIEFYRDISPNAVRNFEYLALKHFYDGITIHRYEPGFVVQMGDPIGNGKGGPGYTIPPEFSKTKHERGSLGMARLPDPVNPERRSSGSQFYITFGAARHLDGLYTIFGKVVKGMENVDKLRVGDKIINIRLPKEHKPAFSIKKE